MTAARRANAAGTAPAAARIATSASCGCAGAFAT
jgi:hypothetical protein